MFAHYFKKSSSQAIPQQLYGSVMAQARQPGFYGVFGVPDTVMGRFDMLAMHTYMLARRLRGESNKIAQSLNQDVFDLFVADVERALRELGIGDTTVPKRKKKMVRSFYGQIDDFDEVIDSKNMSDLSDKVDARYFADADEGDAKSLAGYMLAVERDLQSQPFDTLMKGEVNWPLLVK